MVYLEVYSALNDLVYQMLRTIAEVDTALCLSDSGSLSRTVRPP